MCPALAVHWMACSPLPAAKMRWLAYVLSERRADEVRVTIDEGLNRRRRAARQLHYLRRVETRTSAHGDFAERCAPNKTRHGLRSAHDFSRQDLKLPTVPGRIRARPRIEGPDLPLDGIGR